MKQRGRIIENDAYVGPLLRATNGPCIEASGTTRATLILMSSHAAALVFVVGFVAIRIVSRIATHYGPQAADRGSVIKDRVDIPERVYMALFLVGGLILPIMRLVGVLDSLRYELPDWAGWFGIAMMLLAGIIQWRAHFDLGRNYSVTVRARARQSLVTNGVFAWMRHPIYASLWLIVLAQPLLVQHWVFGFSGAITFAMLYFHRLPREEAMMGDLFGDDYGRYARRVGRLIPRLRSR